MDFLDDVLGELNIQYEKNNIYYQTIGTMLMSAARLDMPERLRLILTEPKNELMIHFPVRMDSGEYRLFKGYRVQHNNVLGPYKGGVRFHHEVSLDHIKALAALMTMKTALFHLPLGGAKGGVRVNPGELSEDELMRLTRRFTSALGSNISPTVDIPAPDVGTNAQVMAWMADTYMNLHEDQGHTSGLAVVTGKPVAFGGSYGREEATAMGLLYVLEQLMPELGFPLKEVSFSVQGYGNVGSWAGRLLGQSGSMMKAVMDHTGAIFEESGIDPEALAAYVRDNGGVRGYPQAQAISLDEFYSTKVDLFVPAALEQMIDLPCAQKLNCKVIAEGANAPLTPEAENYLQNEHGVTILPAILCNAGGVTVSYFEWQQNRSAVTWSKVEVLKKLRQYVNAATDRVKKASGENHCSFGMAAYCVALQHIDQVYRMRGIFP